MAQTFGLPQYQGNATANNGAATGTVIAAQSGKTIRVTKGIVNVTVAAVGGSGLVRICDGTTTIVSWSADAVGTWPFDFGDTGYALTAGNAFQIIVSGAGTTQATANCAAVGLVA